MHLHLAIMTAIVYKQYFLLKNRNIHAGWGEEKQQEHLASKHNRVFHLVMLLLLLLKMYSMKNIMTTGAIVLLRVKELTDIDTDTKGRLRCECIF